MMLNDCRLIVTAVGPEASNLVHNLAKLCVKHSCHIIESKIQRMDQEIALMMAISGQWHNIAKFEAAIPKLKNKANSEIVCKRTLLSESPAEGLPYQAQIIAQDRPGILAELCSFFSKHSIQIDDCSAETYMPSKSETKMCQLQVNIRIPTKCHLANMRDKFIAYCEELNLDALLEPLK